MARISRRTLAKGALGSLVALALRTPVAAEAAKAKPALFDPMTLKDLQLANRMVMAPLTRGRAGSQRTANALMAEYYAQRADAGLIIAEATAISPQGYGWVGSPGIYTSQHVAGWKSVTDAVHQRGGRIVLQLWHLGRVSHPDFLDGAAPVGPSAITPQGDIYTPAGKKPYVTPRAMTQEDIVTTVRDYAAAATRAREAGFDGVEIHAANGYLIDQFIRDGSNRRTDDYGGSLQNRLRFMLEVVEAVTKAWSAARTGIRFSPTNAYNDMSDGNPAETFAEAARMLNRFGLAYLHVVEQLPTQNRSKPVQIAPQLRAAFDGAFILNGGYDASTGTAALAAGEADLIAYGRFFLANPDLVQRFRRDVPLNKADISTFYTEGAKGYTDYPRFQS
jgi:N-ethylmaleimide reductase